MISCRKVIWFTPSSKFERERERGDIERGERETQRDREREGDRERERQREAERQREKER